MQTKQAFKIALQRRQARIMEAVNVMERTYERAQPCGKEEVDANLRQKDETRQRFKVTGRILYLERLHLQQMKWHRFLN